MRDCVSLDYINSIVTRYHDTNTRAVPFVHDSNRVWDMSSSTTDTTKPTRTT